MPTNPGNRLCVCGHQACNTLSHTHPLNVTMPSSSTTTTYNIYAPLASLSPDTDSFSHRTTTTTTKDDGIDTCFNVVVTERNDPQCEGWGCWFCKRYYGWGGMDGDSEEEWALKCGGADGCGGIEEREVVFVKRVDDDEDEGFTVVEGRKGKGKRMW